MIRPEFPAASAVAAFFGALVLVACGTTGPAEETAAVEEAAGRAPGPNELSSTEAEAGWRLLFDGVSFEGWRGLGRDAVPAGHWTIEDGAIRKVASGDVPTATDGQPLEGGDLMTVETFRDFELMFEWRVAPGANSGIKYNVSEEMSTSAEPVHAALGFEYQILDDDLHPDALNGPNRTAGALYDLTGPAPGQQLRPVGEFNQVLVQEKGLTGSVEGGINMLGNMFNYDGPMLWTGYLFHDSEFSSDTLMSVINQVVEEMRTQPIDEATLQLAKVKMRSSLYDSIDEYFGFGLADLLLFVLPD